MVRSVSGGHWCGGAGCEPPDQAVPRSTENNDEDVSEDGGEGVGEVFWIGFPISLSVLGKPNSQSV